MSVHVPTVRRDGAGYGLVMLAAVLWGTDGLFRLGLALELPAVSVVVAEHVILVALTLPWLLRVLPSLRSLTVWDTIALLFIGIGASAVATLLFTAAFSFGDPTTPLLLQKLQPLIAIVAARLFLGERLVPGFWGYCAVALAGSYLLTFADPFRVGVGEAAPALLAVGAAGLWGMGTVCGRHLSHAITPEGLLALRVGIGLLASGLIFAATDDPWPLTASSPQDALALLGLALVPGLIALTLYYRGLRHTTASAATLAELAFPVTAVVVNHFFFEQSLAASQWIGVIVLVAAITAIGLRRNTWVAADRSREATWAY